MARRQTRSSFASRAAPRPMRPPAAINKTAVSSAAPAKPQPQPQPTVASNPMSQGQSSVGGGLLSTMASGMAFGTGSAIAHRAVDAVIGGGPSHRPAEEQPAPGAPMSSASNFGNEGSSDPCSADLKAFQDCLAANGNSLSNCKYFFDMLQQCQLRSPQQPSFSYGDD